MTQLLDLPPEILESIFSYLSQMDLSSAVRACRALKPNAERCLYRTFNFEGFIQWFGSEPSPELHEAKPLRHLFRTMVCRPELGSYLRRFRYYGTSRSIYRDKLRWDDQIGPIGSRLDKDVLPIFNEAEMEAFDRLFRQLSSSFTSLAFSAVYLPFSKRVKEQGLVLAMIDVLLLLCPGVENVSIEINVEGEDRVPPLRLCCFDMVLNHARSDHQNSWLSRFSSLSDFTFYIRNVWRPYYSATFDAQNITDVLYLPAIKNLIANNPNTAMSQVPPESRPAFSTERLVVDWVQCSPGNFGLWMRACPGLKSLAYQMYLDVDIEDNPWIDCRALENSLDSVQNSLEDLELLYSVTSSWSHETRDVAGCGVKSRLRSLKRFDRLEHLMINFTLLQGGTIKQTNVTNLGLLLPPRLKSFFLVDDGWTLFDYDWQDSTVRDICMKFIREFQEYTPALRLFRFFSREGPDLQDEPRLWQNVIENARLHGLLAELAPFDDFENWVPGAFRSLVRPLRSE